MPAAELRLPPTTGWATPAALCAALAAGVCVQLALPTAEPVRPAVPPRHPARTDAGRPLGLATANLVLADGADALARPPFSPSRASADAATPAATLGLLGLARIGGAALATVQDAGGAVTTLRVGESFQGWRLIGVSGDHATIGRAGEARTLRVGDRPVALPSPAAAPGAAPAPASVFPGAGGASPDATSSSPGGPT